MNKDTLALARQCLERNAEATAVVDSELTPPFEVVDTAVDSTLSPLQMLEKTGLTLDAVQNEFSRDWEHLNENPKVLAGLIKSFADGLNIKRGIRPKSFTAEIDCKRLRSGSCRTWRYSVPMVLCRRLQKMNLPSEKYGKEVLSLMANIQADYGAPLLAHWLFSIAITTMKELYGSDYVLKLYDELATKLREHDRELN